MTQGKKTIIFAKKKKCSCLFTIVSQIFINIMKRLNIRNLWSWLKKQTQNKTLYRGGGGRFYFQNGKNFMRKTCTVFCGKYYLLNCNWQKRMFPVSEMLTKHSWHWSKMEGLTTPQASFSFTRTSLLSNHLWEAVKAKTLNRILIRITR